jgi:multiple RNA-binding domain-containing protein 1
MSRLIVKNLPKVVNEHKLRKLFEQKGTVTDIQLKYKDGKFRQFCFVGYENEQSAEEAVKFFNGTFVGTSKVNVEVCAALGDDSKPKSWSKYAKDSETFKKKQKDTVEKEESEGEHSKPNKKEPPKVKKIDALIGEYKNDPQFQEFMKSHTKSNLLWENDLCIVESTVTGDSNESKKNIEESISTKLANQGISDADYMKTLMGKDEKSFEKDDKKAKNHIKLFTVKIRNIPKKIKREELKKFFRPSKAHSVRIPKNSTFAYAGFKLERDMKRALTKDKSFLNGKQIHVYEFIPPTENASQNESINKNKSNPKWKIQEDTLKSEDTISDSGKLFFRNLPYTTTEDDLQKVFEKHGNVVEINVPIDTLTRKIKVKYY